MARSCATVSLMPRLGVKPALKGGENVTVPGGTAVEEATHPGGTAVETDGVQEKGDCRQGKRRSQRQR